MPTFDDGDPMDTSDFRQQHRDLEAMFARDRKERDDEIRKVHKALLSEDKEEQKKLSLLEQALKDHEELYGEEEDDEPDCPGSF